MRPYRYRYGQMDGMPRAPDTTQAQLSTTRFGTPRCRAALVRMCTTWTPTNPTSADDSALTFSAQLTEARNARLRLWRSRRSQSFFSWPCSGVDRHRAQRVGGAGAADVDATARLRSPSQHRSDRSAGHWLASVHARPDFGACRPLAALRRAGGRRAGRGHCDAMSVRLRRRWLVTGLSGRSPLLM